MGALGSIFTRVGDTWKGFSKSRKIAISILAVGFMTAMVVLIIQLTKVEYEILFSGLEPQDSAKIVEKLKEDKIPYKIDGTSILVPKKQVDELRMSLFTDTSIPSSIKGFELFDNSKFGVTDTEAKIMYQRALEGELARTIQSFNEVEKARVHLVLPEESVFTRDTEKARASVTLKLKVGAKLSQEQVKGIISLISSSVKNLPKENVDVIDSDMNLLSEGIFEGENKQGLMGNTKQLEYKKEFESNLQNDIKWMLEKIFGKDKVSVKVSSELDFNSKEISIIKYDKDAVVRSQHKIKEESNDSNSQGAGGSPIDNNMSNTIQNSNQSSSSKREEETTNYEIGQTEERIIKSPGEVKRISVSVVIDGSINDAEKQEIESIVGAVIGYSKERGDMISIVAMPFNTDYKDKVAKDLEEMKKLEEQEAKRRLYRQIGIGVASLIGVIILLSIIARIRNKQSNETLLNEPSVDYVIGETVKEMKVYEPVLDDEEEMNLEKEIRHYAENKPDQVVELIKTWLAEDER